MPALPLHSHSPPALAPAQSLLHIHPLRSAPALLPLQVDALGSGPFLCQLEELSLGANLTLQPASLPGELLQLARLRRLGLPLWWRLAGGPYAHAQALLLQAMPWLLLEHQ